MLNGNIDRDGGRLVWEGGSGRADHDGGIRDPKMRFAA